MKTLTSKPSQRLVVIATVLALLATVVIWFQFSEPEAAMQSSGYGIVSYELAFTAERADTILEAWGSTGVQQARRSLLIDFGFIPAYGIFFAGITLLIARVQIGYLQSSGLVLVLAVFVAALCDVLENLMLLSLLGQAGAVPAAPPPIAGVAASIKFLILLAAVVYWVIGDIVLIVRLIRERRGQ